METAHASKRAATETLVDPVVMRHADPAATCAPVVCLACARGTYAAQPHCPLCRGVLLGPATWRVDTTMVRLMNAAPRRCKYCGVTAAGLDAMCTHHRAACPPSRLLLALESHANVAAQACDCADGCCRIGARLAAELPRVPADLHPRIVDWMAERRRVRPATCLEGLLLAEEGRLACPLLMELWAEASTNRAPPLGPSEALHVIGARTPLAVSLPTTARCFQKKKDRPCWFFFFKKRKSLAFVPKKCPRVR